MRVVVVACLGLAACDDAIGITVTVPPGTGHVDLFIGKKDCFEDGNRCPGIGPPGSQGLIPGEVFWVDNVEPFGLDVPAGATEVAFRLEPGHGTLPVVVAVGSGGQQLSVAILEDIELDTGAINYVGTLEPAVGMLTADKMPITDAFQIWAASVKPGETPYRCMGAQFRGRRVFVVPENDFDCDVVDDGLECSPFVASAMGANFLNLEDTTCTLDGSVAGMGHCFLGGLPCDETGTVSDQRCGNRNQICISDAMCCGDPATTNCFDKAYGINGGAAATAQMIECTIAVAPDANNTVLGFCAQEIDPALGAPLGLDPMAQCNNAELGEAKFPFDRFEDSYDYSPANNHTVQFHPKLSSTMASGCTFGLSFDGTFPIGTPPQPHTFMMDVDSGGVTVVLPVIVKYVPTATAQCPGENKCHLLPGTPIDTVLGCIQ